ncbi:MAG: hypothetical protein AB2693_19550, partial [Candidatus Thiodiazotropha sp.]
GEDLEKIIIENNKAIALTFKELAKADKDSEKEFEIGYDYKGNIMPIFDKNILKSLTNGRPISEIKIENDKAIAMTLKELNSSTVSNANSKQTTRHDTKKVQVNNTNELVKRESNTFDLFSGYLPNSSMSLKEIYLKSIRKTDGMKEDLNNIMGEKADQKAGDGADGSRSSLNSFSDMTDYMQRHYLLTSALLSLMEVCDNENRQNENEDIDQYMAKESTTKKECVRELLHLAENLTELSKAAVNIDENDKKQEQSNDIARHQAFSGEIRKADDIAGEKRATDINKGAGKNQFRKTKELELVKDTGQIQTTDRATVYDTAIRGQKKEFDKLEEARLGRTKESQKSVCDGNPETAVSSVNDENDYQNHANGTDIDEIYEARRAYNDDIGKNQIDYSTKKEDIEVKHGIGGDQKEPQNITAGEVTKQNIEIKAEDKRRDKVAKRLNDRKRNAGQDKQISKTIDASRAVGDETRKGFQRDIKTDSYKTKKTAEDERQGNTQGLFLPADIVYQLMVDTYNERRYKTKKKSRNKASLQFEIDWQVNMEGKIIAAELPEKLHTITDKRYTMPVVDEENMKKRKKKKINSRGDRKAGKHRKRDKGARHRNQNFPEKKTGAEMKPNSGSSENESMTLAAVYCDG